MSTERVQEVYNRSLLELLTEYSDINAQSETLQSWKRMMTSEPEIVGTYKLDNYENYSQNGRLLTLSRDLRKACLSSRAKLAIE